MMSSASGNWAAEPALPARPQQAQHEVGQHGRAEKCGHASVNGIAGKYEHGNAGDGADETGHDGEAAEPDSDA